MAARRAAQLAATKKQSGVGELANPAAFGAVSFVGSSPTPGAHDQQKQRSEIHTFSLVGPLAQLAEHRAFNPADGVRVPDGPRG